MTDRFTVQLSDLPEYGVRARSRYAQVVHRFADDHPIPACAGTGRVKSESPSDYKRERLAVVATTRRYSLCSHGHCFGRLQLANPADSESESPEKFQT